MPDQKIEEWGYHEDSLSLKEKLQKLTDQGRTINSVVATDYFVNTRPFPEPPPEYSGIWQYTDKITENKIAKAIIIHSLFR